MKKIIVLASLLMSASVFASTSTIQADRTFSTDNYATKEQAYQAGFDLVNDFKQMPQNELKYKLITGSRNVIHNSLEVNDANVSVEEVGNANGQIQYHAVVDVDYQYKYRESNHS